VTLSRGKRLALAGLCVLAVGASMLFRRNPDAPVRFEAEARKLVTRKLPSPRGAGEHAQLLQAFEEKTPRLPTAATADPDTHSREFAAHPSRSFHPGGAMLEPADTLSLSQPLPDELLADASSEATPAPATRTHRVVDGDTLAKLAARYLGSSDRYGEIFAANRPLLSTPDLLPIGVELVIPPRQRPAPPVALGPEDAPDASPSDEVQMPLLEVETAPVGNVESPDARQSDRAGATDDDSALVPVPKDVSRQEE
jgi:LysM repeat protein